MKTSQEGSDNRFQIIDPPMMMGDSLLKVEV